MKRSRFVPIKECLPDTWAVFYEPDSRMQSIFLWMQGKIPHFILEAGGSPLLPGGGQCPGATPMVSNPVSMTTICKVGCCPHGKLIQHGELPGSSAVAVGNHGCLSRPMPEVLHASRAVIRPRDGLIVVSDRFFDFPRAGAFLANPGFERKFRQWLRGHSCRLRWRYGAPSFRGWPACAFSFRAEAAGSMRSLAV